MNVIVKTQGRLCLEETYDRLGYGMYNPKNFSALTLKFVNPKMAINVFSTGNITIMGCKNKWIALYVMIDIKEELELEITKFSVTNIVATFSLKKSIDIERIYALDKTNSICDMETFPSCTYSIPNTNIKANFFNSGKVVVTGCTDESEIQTSIEYLLNNIIKQASSTLEN